MRAYERLINYAKVYTTSDPDSTTVPTTAVTAAPAIRAKVARHLSSK